MMDTLQVAKREKTGSMASRRLRRGGQVPAVLYGHGQANEHLTVPQSDVDVLLRHRGKMVQLRGAVDETALVSQMQWDPMGIEVLHLDLIRVDLKEKVDVSVSIQTHGEAAGTQDGGMLLLNLHEVDIRCPAGSIPDHVGLDVSGIQLGDFRTVADLELPADVELVTSADTIVASVVQPQSADEDLEATSAEVGAEPEVIGGAKEDTEES
jgi:large subunit ribosomal protein L25